MVSHLILVVLHVGQSVESFNMNRKYWNYSKQLNMTWMELPEPFKIYK